MSEAVELEFGGARLWIISLRKRQGAPGGGGWGSGGGRKHDAPTCHTRVTAVNRLHASQTCAAAVARA